VLAAVEDKPFRWPRKVRPSLTATRHDGAVELRSWRKNSSAGVKPKEWPRKQVSCQDLSSRYARVESNFLVQTGTIADFPIRHRDGAYGRSGVSGRNRGMFASRTP
jgi:hypothetical protein